MRTDRHGLHQKLVARPRASGIKAATGEFGCARGTDRRWLRRYQPGKSPAPAAAQRLPRLLWLPAALAYEGRAPPPRAETSPPSGERRPGRTREDRFTAGLTGAGPTRTNAADEEQPAIREGLAFG